MFLLKLLLNFIPGIGPIMSAISTFFSTALAFVVKHWKFFAIGALVGTILYQNFATTRFVFGLETIPHEQTVIAQRDKDIVGLKANLATVVTANKNLTDSIGQLNSTIGQWKSITDDLKKKNADLQKRLNQMRVDTDKKVKDILNTKTPVTCEDSFDFLRAIREKLTW